MAARIGAAALKRDPRVIIRASDYNKREHGAVICPDCRCGCDLQGVPRSTRNIEKDDGKPSQITVNAFFRLPKNAEKINKGHLPRCRYNVSATIAKLVARSKEIRSFDPESEPILNKKAGEPAEYRLHILMEALDSAAFGLKENPNKPLKEKLRAHVGYHYIRTNNVLRPYLRMARAINSLLARIQGDPSIADVLRLRYGENEIKWDKYFYDLDDHARLFSFLKGNSQHKRRYNTSLDRPIAFVVQRRTGWEPRRTIYHQWQIPCEGRLCNLSPNVKAFINPVIYTGDEKIKSILLSRDFFLICAIPTVTDIQPQNRERPGIAPQSRPRYPHATINLRLVDRSQICAYTPSSKEN